MYPISEFEHLFSSPVGIFSLSAELCAIHLTVDAFVNYNIEFENILCLSDSRSALLLPRNINRIANDKDLYNITRQILNLKTKDNQIYFQHGPSHKGIKYDEMADSLAAKASMLIPSPSSNLNSQDIMRQISNDNYSKLILSPFHTKLNAMLYHGLKKTYEGLRSRKSPRNYLPIN